MEWIRKRKFNRTIIAALLMTMTVWLLPAGLMADKAEAATTLKNPRIVEDSSMYAGQKVTWDCVWFGSYPQSEVVCETDSDAIANLETMNTNFGVEYSKVSENIWNSIVNASYDGNGDAKVGSTKYRRIKKGDATYATYGDSNYYKWGDDTVRYFRYEPIKWRVLNVNGTDAFLLADKALDDQCYNNSNTSITWETCTIRSWLNGYDSSSNSYGRDYTKFNFINTAFTSSERSAIKTTEVANDNNISYGTAGGNDTSDKVFLLSENEVYNSNTAFSYGFTKSDSKCDEGRRCKSSTFAKAMGVYSSIIDSSTYAGNCFWWLRSPGYDTDIAADVSNDGHVVSGGGSSVNCDVYAVRPALHLDLSSSDLYSYAGTVCSDGTVNEEGGGVVTPDDPDSNQVDGTVSVPYISSYDKTDRSLSVKYRDGFFTAGNQKYDMDLSKVSLGLTMTTMKQKKSGSKYVWDDSNTKSFLKNTLKFDEGYKPYNQNKSLTDTSDKAAYAIAHKKVSIDGSYTTIVAVAVRSANYGGEWYSNGQVSGGSDSKLHKGFSGAAAEISDSVKAYMRDNGISSDAKIWITGFSRGGAVANLTGRMLVNRSAVKAENMYCYTFAAPLTTKKLSRSQLGIFNTVNSFDMIPDVPMKSWGFGRYGDNYYLPSKMNKGYATLKKQADQSFNELTGQSYGVYWNHLLFKEKLLDSLNGAVGYTESSYAKNFQGNVSTLLGSTMGDTGKDADTAGLLNSLLCVNMKSVNTSVLATIGTVILGITNVKDLSKGRNSKLFRQHWPEAYMAWLQQGKVYNNLGTKLISVKCPVDVYVYDKSDGSLVAEIKDEDFEKFQEENPDMALEAYVDENGQKQVLVPGDGDYTVKVVAREDGKMNYAISEYENEELVRKTNYTDVKIKENDEFECSLEAVSEPLTEEFELIKNGDMTIPQTEQLTEDNLESIDIDAQAEGDGAVFGGGSYTSGDSVVLKAVTSDTSVFTGWYENGKLISEESDYGFLAEKDRTIVGKFKTVKGDIFGSESMIRIAGDNRYATSTAAADALKKSLAADKFENIIVASGADYPDALAGSYLAKVKNAPVMLVGKDANTEADVKQYINKNLKKSGTVYLLGGTGVVTSRFEKSLGDLKVERLGGQTRYETNIAILKAAGVDKEDLLVCTGEGFADSLSASAVGKPILLVAGSGVDDTQKKYLGSLKIKDIYLIGGTGVVSDKTGTQLKKYDQDDKCERVAGQNRYLTSVAVAEEFFPKGSDSTVLAYAMNFPDGLAGGPLALSIKAPLILTDNSGYSDAVAYAKNAGIKKAVVLGGPTLISDGIVKNIIK
ncbi:N-acetylmuramoyl-L-alanine amidase LytC precursor [uncultured Eubacterium sp.]|uniref:cell wall-binding repeat-containing protein n=1 Tax=Brotomerdimonas butyrica TaxID=2981721 RepID=UPI000820EC84|nr:cell wall-binding repeat-containing protein [Brotomerdimonas butyrica]MCU6756083.1 cell wall-binding repeat-containing protein [Brotomerdimonas butyrica]SCH65376.1 N-acetylmuramoyl-L-alanine amidase LytC precursor [uncultured Eubacterium sp.]